MQYLRLQALIISIECMIHLSTTPAAAATKGWCGALHDWRGRGGKVFHVAMQSCQTLLMNVQPPQTEKKLGASHEKWNITPGAGSHTRHYRQTDRRACESSGTGNATMKSTSCAGFFYFIHESWKQRFQRLLVLFFSARKRKKKSSLQMAFSPRCDTHDCLIAGLASQTKTRSDNLILALKRVGHTASEFLKVQLQRSDSRETFY